MGIQDGQDYLILAQDDISAAIILSDRPRDSSRGLAKALALVGKPARAL